MALEYAFRLSLISFIAKLLLGVVYQWNWDATLMAALGITIPFFGIGFALGFVCRHLVKESVLSELVAASEAGLQSSHQSASN